LLDGDGITVLIRRTLLGTILSRRCGLRKSSPCANDARDLQTIFNAPLFIEHKLPVTMSASRTPTRSSIRGGGQGCTPNHELYRIVPEYRAIMLDGGEIKRVMFVDSKDERLKLWKPCHNITAPTRTR